VIRTVPMRGFGRCGPAAAPAVQPVARGSSDRDNDSARTCAGLGRVLARTRVLRPKMAAWGPNGRELAKLTKNLLRKGPVSLYH